MTIPKFHTYQEMCEHLAKGGAAYRFGSHYPLYYGQQYGLDWGQTRFCGDSAGECVKAGMDFTSEEQRSNNWVFISKEEMEARDKAMAEGYRKILEEKDRQLKAIQDRNEAQRTLMLSHPHFRRGVLDVLTLKPIAEWLRKLWKRICPWG